MEEDSKVLEIGAGSGYQLSILAEIADRVVGVEVQRNLVDLCQKNVRGYQNVEVRQGSSALDGGSDFDRVLYSFATNSIEDALRVLKPEGVLFAPLNRNSTQSLIKWKSGRFKDFGRVRYVRSQQ